MITAEKKTAQDGRFWIRVQYKANKILDQQMSTVPGAKHSPLFKAWDLPWSSLVKFEEAMGDYLIVWKNEENPTKGGIDEDLIPDQPTIPGYSVTYGVNDTGERIITGSTGFKTKPWGEFQVKGFNCLVDRRFLILADDAGLGKTWQVGNAIEAMKKQGRVKHGIVLVKASLLYNWRKELHMHTHERAVVVAGTQKKRHKLYSDLILKDDWTFMIMSYETYREDTMNVQWLDNMRKLDFCIMDEAHKIKNSQSELGDKIHAVPFTYRYVLTATPLPNSPLEAFNYLKFGKVLPEEIDWWIAFKNHFAIWGGSMNREVLAYQNIKELKSMIQENMLRRLKKDKLKDLPAATFKTIPIPMLPAQRKLYDAVVKEIMADLKDTALTKIPSALTKLLRLQQVTDSPALIGDEKTKSAKLDALDDLLDELIDSGEKKVIVFSRFREMTEVLKERYARYNPAIIHGDVDANGKSELAATRHLRNTHPEYTTLDSEQRRRLIDAFTQSERQQMVAKFQEDDSCRLFIGCAPACREGLTLTAATHVVFLDCEWSPAYVEQAFSRAHRIGQKDAVTVYYLVCEETIDEYVQDVLERKDALAQTMLDEGIESVGAIRAKEMIQIMATGKVA
jgi:SNF2 family DNA or RNA helicase